MSFLRYCDICIDDRHLYKWRTRKPDFFLNPSPIKHICIRTTIISLDETVINVQRNKIWPPFFKWPLNHYGTKYKKWQQGILSSIYYLDDFNICCQDNTQTYASFTLADALVTMINYSCVPRS